MPFFYIDGSRILCRLWCNVRCSAAVSSAVDGRRTICMTAVVRVADGRHTIRKQTQQERPASVTVWTICSFNRNITTWTTRHNNRRSPSQGLARHQDITRLSISCRQTTTMPRQLPSRSWPYGIHKNLKPVKKYMCNSTVFMIQTAYL